MTGQRDGDLLVRSWLQDGVTALPDRVIDAVLDELPAVPQRRSRLALPALSWPRLSRVDLALAVAVLTLAILLLDRFVAPNVGDEAPEATPPPAAPAAYLHDGRLDAGPYRVAVADGLELTVDVPAGWNGFSSWGLIGPSGEWPPNGAMLGFWDVGNLYVDPLDPLAGVLDPPLGRDVDALVRGLAAQPGQLVGEPVDVVVDGYPGRMIELRIPATTAFDDCMSGFNQYRLWVSAEDVSHYRCLQGPGQIERVWAIDVNGRRLVISAGSFPDTSPADLADIEAMIDSIQIDTD